MKGLSAIALTAILNMSVSMGAEGDIESKKDSGRDALMLPTTQNMPPIDSIEMAHRIMKAALTGLRLDVYVQMFNILHQWDKFEGTIGGTLGVWYINRITGHIRPIPGAIPVSLLSSGRQNASDIAAKLRYLETQGLITINKGVTADALAVKLVN